MDEINLTTILIIAVIIGLLPAGIAKSKGYNFFSWWFYGAAAFIVALPWSIIMKPAEPEVKGEILDPSQKNSSRIIAELANLQAIKGTGALSDEDFRSKEELLKKELQNPYVDYNPNVKVKIKNNASGEITSIKLSEWVKLKESGKSSDYTPIIVVVDKNHGNYLTFSIHQWKEIKTKGLQENYKIFEGVDVD